MAEIAGLALSVAGAVGILGQIFSGCITGYRVFSSATNLGRDSQRLVCKIRIEEMRLVVWGREWGVVEGKFESHLSSSVYGHEGLKDLATEILSQLLQTILDCNKLQDKYGLREAAPGSVDKEAYIAIKRSVSTRSFLPGKFKDEWKLRARWVIADKEQFEQLLDDLQYFNDKLEKLFPPSRLPSLQRTWTNELLQTAQRDIGRLETLESASCGRYPGLNALAQLKQLRINLDAREPSRKILSSSELKIPQWRLKVLEEASNELRRSAAVHQRLLPRSSASESKDVIVDWITFDPNMGMDSRLQLYQRVDNLARMLHSCSQRHPDLYTLDCVGYVEDSANCRYGIVLSPPTMPTEPDKTLSCSTLSSLIEDPAKRTPDLDVRFRLAQTLAVALWSFHSLDWLHKSFCSLNILFFERPRRENSQRHDLSRPAVVGFDGTRPDGLVEMTFDTKSPNGEDLYRHPDSLGISRQTYRKAFDIFSLGLLLLEIGLWKSVKAIHKPRYTPTTFREKAIQVLVPALGSKVGSTYRTVVERCLSYDKAEGEPENLGPHQMLEWVVLALEGLKV